VTFQLHDGDQLSGTLKSDVKFQMASLTQRGVLARRWMSYSVKPVPRWPHRRVRAIRTASRMAVFPAFIWAH